LLVVSWDSSVSWDVWLFSIVCMFFSSRQLMMNNNNFTKSLTLVYFFVWPNLSISPSFNHFQIQITINSLTLELVKWAGSEITKRGMIEDKLILFWWFHSEPGPIAITAPIPTIASMQMQVAAAFPSWLKWV